MLSALREHPEPACVDEPLYLTNDASVFSKFFHFEEANASADYLESVKHSTGYTAQDFVPRVIDSDNAAGGSEPLRGTGQPRPLRGVPGVHDSQGWTMLEWIAKLAAASGGPRILPFKHGRS